MKNKLIHNKKDYVYCHNKQCNKGVLGNWSSPFYCATCKPKMKKRRRILNLN